MKVRAIQAHSRARLDVKEIDLATWATVDTAQIKSAKKVKQYEDRSAAMWMYANGGTAKAAAKVIGTSERNFYRLWARCLEIANDGKPWGFRALVPRTRPHSPVRTAVLKPFAGKSANAGFSGVFMKLLRDRPNIRMGLVEALNRLGTEAYVPTTVKGRELHKKFIQLCEQEKIGTDEYPLNTIERGKRSLHEWVKREYLPRYTSAFVKAEHGQDAAASYDYQREGDQRRAPALAWQEWQIDEVSRSSARRSPGSSPGRLSSDFSISEFSRSGVSVPLRTKDHFRTVPFASLTWTVTGIPARTLWVTVQNSSN